MFKVIIYWDSGLVQEICAETKPELYQKLDTVTINPDEAIWEFTWVPSKREASQVSLDNMMGQIGKVG